MSDNCIQGYACVDRGVPANEYEAFERVKSLLGGEKHKEIDGLVIDLESSWWSDEVVIDVKMAGQEGTGHDSRFRFSSEAHMKKMDDNQPVPVMEYYFSRLTSEGEFAKYSISPRFYLHPDLAHRMGGEFLYTRQEFDMYSKLFGLAPKAFCCAFQEYTGCQGQ